MSGDIKSLLKEARDALAAKRHADAVSLCERAVQRDPDNYMAHVLLGAALQQHAGAERAFRTAARLDPTKPLAWQGLATYYEKSENVNVSLELISIYREILKLNVESGKMTEVITKLGQLGRTADTCTCQVVRSLLEYCAQASDQKYLQTANNQLASLLCTEAVLLCDPDMVLPAIENFLMVEPTDYKLQLNYAKLLSAKNKLDTLISTVIKLNGFSSNIMLKEWMCRHIFEVYVGQGTLEGANLSDIEEELTREVDWIISRLIRCLLLADSGQIREAYELGIKILDPSNMDETLVLFIVKCSVALCHWKAAEQLIASVLVKVKNKSIDAKLKRLWLVCCVRTEQWDRGSELGLQLRGQPHFTREDTNLLATCLAHRGIVDDELLKQLQDTEYYDSLVALNHVKKNELEKAKIILENSVSNIADRWLYLGIVYWLLDEKEKCLMPLLKSTKLDPSRFTSFLYLGHYYRHAGRPDRARRCYEKAHSLHSGNADTARALSSVLHELGDVDADYALLQVASSTLDPGELWARLQLGLHELTRQRWDHAIVSLRGVVRTAPQHCLAWASLADAYFNRRSFTSALKCYTRVVQLTPDDVYAKTQIATAKHYLGLNQEALTEYEEVLVMEPQCLMALKGISESLCALADELLEQQLYNQSRESAQRSLEYTVRAVVVAPEFSCLWKLLADTLVLLARYPPRYAYAHVPGVLLGIADSVCKMKDELLPLAISCYSRAIRLVAHDATSLYRDVSVTYLALYEETGDTKYCRHAFSVARHCVKCRSSDWEYWNLLGVISASDGIGNERFAQYCFLKAVACNRSCPVAWTNLGVVYLRRGDYRAANKTMKRAQEDDPDYVRSWIGQALIAESVREDEAMDLFRHAAALGFHTEAAQGYADWVCRTLRARRHTDSDKFKDAIESTHALSVALDLMTRVCLHRPREFQSATLQGSLREHAGLLRGARESFQIALETSRTQEERNAAILNLGRVLLQNGDGAQALETLQRVTQATFASACCTALALYRTGAHEEALAACDAVLHWLAEKPEHKADVLVAMAAIAYKLKGPDEAKTILFQSIKMCEIPTAHSLLATCSLGIVHGDRGLSQLAMSELKRYESDPEHAPHVAFLVSYLAAREGAVALPAAAQHAACAELWARLARASLHLLEEAGAEAACACAERALACGGVADAALLCAHSVARYLTEAPASASVRALARRAVRVAPDSAPAWAALVLTELAGAGAGGERRALLRDVVSRARRRLTLTRNLALWLGRVERMLEQAASESIEA